MPRSDDKVANQRPAALTRMPQVSEPKEGGGSSAWAKDNAPLACITEFMSAVQANEMKRALELANTILEYEPQNETIQQFLPMLKKKEELNQQEATSSSEEEEDEEESEEEEPTDQADCKGSPSGDYGMKK